MMESVREWWEANKHKGTVAKVGQRVMRYAAEPGTGPKGRTCRECRHMRRVRAAKTYFKCGLVWNGGNSAASDIKARAPACERFMWEGERVKVEELVLEDLWAGMEPWETRPVEELTPRQRMLLGVEDERWGDVRAVAREGPSSRVLVVV